MTNRMQQLCVHIGCGDNVLKQFEIHSFSFPFAVLQRGCCKALAIQLE